MSLRLLDTASLISPCTNPGAWTRPPLPLPGEQDLLDEAGALVRDILNTDPNRAEALHLLGCLAMRTQREELAIVCFRRAIETVGKEHVEWLGDLADALERRGTTDEAVSVRLRVLRRRPDDPLAFRMLGKALRSHGKYREAIASYREALRLQPESRITIGELGDVLDAAGDPVAALAQYQASLRLCSDDAATHGRIGRIHLQQRNLMSARDAFTAGLECESVRDTDRAELLFGVGQVQVALRQYQDAATTFRAALSIDPTHLGALSRLVFVLEMLGQSVDTAQAWLALGAALEDRARVQEAISAYRQVLARQPGCLDARLRLGSLQLLVGETADALSHLKAAVAIAPDHATAHVKLGFAHHLTGDANEGWEELSWLSLAERLKTWHACEQPIWDGTSLQGRTVLLWAPPDLGLGDTLQFVRCVRHLKAHGADRVIVECQRSLLPLVASVPGVSRAVGRQSPLPPFDVHVPMMHVPVLDRAARQPTQQDVPYLSIDQRYVEYWREQLGAFDGMTIGLCWSAQSTRRDRSVRSMPLSTFLPLASLKGVRFVSLQLGPGADETFVPPRGLEVKRMLSDASSVTHTAALIQAVDLVITIDTMVAHLAGALGQAVWTLLPYGADWRWGRAETTPWYPTMRLFRQRTVDDWKDVLMRVRSALSEHTTGVPAFSRSPRASSD